MRIVRINPWNSRGKSFDAGEQRLFSEMLRGIRIWLESLGTVTGRARL